MVVFRSIAIFVAVIAIIVAVLPNILLEDLSKFSLHDDKLITSPTTIIVTGANAGLGFATVEHLAQYENSTIIMACRNMEKCSNAKKSIISNNESSSSKAMLIPMELDLSSRSSIVSFAQNLQEVLITQNKDDDDNGEMTTAAPPPVHILINNAGFIGHSDVLEYLEGGIESTVGVNHLGHVFLTHCLWNNLVAGQARIVAVSSGAALFPLNPMKGLFQADDHDDKEQEQSSLSPTTATLGIMTQYARSKRANLMFASELYHRFSKFHNISSTAAHPGYTRSNIARSGWAFAPDWLTEFITHNRFGSLSSEEGALNQVIAALIDRQNLYIGPSYLAFGRPSVLGGLSGSWHHVSFSREESVALWEESMKALNISEFGVMQKA